MKKINFLVSSLLISLSCAFSQQLMAMDSPSTYMDESKATSSLVKKKNQKIDRQVINFQKTEKKTKKSGVTEKSQQKNKKKQNRENPFEKFPKEIKFHILERSVIIDNCLRNSFCSPLKLVCQNWYEIINKNFVNRAILSASKLLGYGEFYQVFLNSILIYRPQKNSDIGMIKLPIAKLANPLDGTFDLSQCGDAGKYLQISTGYRKIKRSENHSTIEIWLTPRFLIEKEINTTAKHFQPIFDKWKNDIPMGIFFTWGDWDDLGWYDYLTKRNMNTISKKSLFENWNVSRYTNYITPRASYTLDIRDEGRSFTDYFFISFNSPTNNTCAEIK